MSENSGEKTFAPTEKKLRDAVKNGDVLRSQDLGTAVAMLIGAAWLHMAGPWLMRVLQQSLRAGFIWDRADLDDFSPGRLMLGIGMVALPPVLVLGVAIILGALGSQIGMGGGAFNGDNLAPKGSRINPLNGLKRMFGPQGWIEMAKGILKVGLLGSIVYAWWQGRMAQIFGLGRGNLSGQLAYGWDTLSSLFFYLAAGLVIIALVDYPIQWVRRYLRLQMSMQDMRDEHKEAEGSPEKKQAIRNRQRQIAAGGVANAMRDAQFVITNPSHFSIAISYDPSIAPAPIVLAKGRGEKALAMRELAAEFGVPVLEYPALARSLYFTTRERQVIREELYAAVAGVLAFVFSLKRGEHPLRPVVDVPVELRFDADGRADPKVKA
ncbi:MAG: flagellar biosynthesis protein FlhB [Novosphingobium sp.]|nr:flagellar biosynthesis protein FlhB [Novosphingobium sp.]